MSNGGPCKDIEIRDYTISWGRVVTPQDEESEVSATLDQVVSGWTERGWAGMVFFRSIYDALSKSFEIDLSSVHPYFEPRTRTSLIEQAEEHILPEETLEYDIYVRMPPVREFTVRAEVASVQKAVPRIVEP